MILTSTTDIYLKVDKDTIKITSEKTESRKSLESEKIVLLEMIEEVNEQIATIDAKLAVLK